MDEKLKLSGQELRRLYPDAHNCLCAAQGREVPVEAFVVRSMNFGQHWRTHGLIDLPYLIQVPESYIRDFLQNDLPERIAALLRFADDDGPPRVIGLSTSRVVDEILEKQHLLRYVVLSDSLFHYKLLDQWLGEWTEHTNFIVNTVDDIVLSSGSICVSGRAARYVADSLAYQDF